MSDNINKGGRKRIPIDQKVFENLCSIQCTLAEIAAVIGCSEDTVERWCVRTYKEGFAETYKKKSQKGKASLRRLQFKHAETNPTMAIWLGKQWLGQRDQMEVEASGKVTIVDDIPDTETEKQED
jgi:hypothetical protein